MKGEVCQAFLEPISNAALESIGKLDSGRRVSWHTSINRLLTACMKKDDSMLKLSRGRLR